MAGSGMHIHVSVLDASGRNIFTSEDSLGNDLLKQAAAGLLETMADGMAVFAPNANSYRRMRPETYVPMHATWGYNNRGAAVRVPVSGAADRRVEHRVSGADANPYLVAAAVLAGMLHGIDRKLVRPAGARGQSLYPETVGAARCQATGRRRSHASRRAHSCRTISARISCGSTDSRAAARCRISTITSCRSTLPGTWSPYDPATRKQLV